MSVAKAEVFKEKRKALTPRRGQQICSHGDGAEQFADEAKRGDPGQEFGSAEVQRCGGDDQTNCDRDQSGRAGFDAKNVSKKRSASHCYARDRGTQCPEIDPSRHPCPTLSHQPASPGIEAARNRELRDNLAEYHCDKQLSHSDEQIVPEHGRPARGDGECKQGVHPDDGREVSEPEREVRPQAHGTIKVRYIAEGLELSSVLISCTDLSFHRLFSRGSAFG